MILAARRCDRPCLARRTQHSTEQLNGNEPRRSDIAAAQCAHEPLYLVFYHHQLSRHSLLRFWGSARIDFMTKAM